MVPHQPQVGLVFLGAKAQETENLEQPQHKLIPLLYSQLSSRTPGVCSCQVLVPALHPGPGRVHRATTP